MAYAFDSAGVDFFTCWLIELGSSNGEMMARGTEWSYLTCHVKGAHCFIRCTLPVSTCISARHPWAFGRSGMG